MTIYMLYSYRFKYIISRAFLSLYAAIKQRVINYFQMLITNIRGYYHFINWNIVYEVTEIHRKEFIPYTVYICWGSLFTGETNPAWQTRPGFEQSEEELTGTAWRLLYKFYSLPITGNWWPCRYPHTHFMPNSDVMDYPIAIFLINFMNGMLHIRHKLYLEW